MLTLGVGRCEAEAGRKRKQRQAVACDRFMPRHGFVVTAANSGRGQCLEPEETEAELQLDFSKDPVV
ncbi:hypothetical protein TPAR_05604 [Tolypocladium paradoxum]|uniref:Uncharacterized protein n=1 Tax=Tolypocladium paradoxum TaxID=94208 RepID=A0A2S4KVK6_9HYPO|nr:hypothetical protein TPAR_05604 [Tolypocladium paradoxum]